MRRINRLDKKAREDGHAEPGASLMIDGKYAGTTVHHPGARDVPFMRPAYDVRRAEAISAVGEHLRTKLTGAAITTPVPDEGDDED